MGYLADRTTPNLAYITGRLGAVPNQPTLRHWNSLKEVLIYLLKPLMWDIDYRVGKKATDGKHIPTIQRHEICVRYYRPKVHVWQVDHVQWSAGSMVLQKTDGCSHVYFGSLICGRGGINTERKYAPQDDHPDRNMFGGSITIKTDNKATVEMIQNPHGKNGGNVFN